MNEVLLREGKRKRMSCATFVRKAFVCSTPDANMLEVEAQQVDTDDVLYCAKLFRRAGRVSIGQLACSCCTAGKELMTNRNSCH